MTDYIYGLDIDEKSPKAEKPSKIKLPLKAHQLACLQKALTMEQQGYINYFINDSRILNGKNVNKIKIGSNIGILGDIVGYGKTLTALSIIAASPLDQIHINNKMNVSYCNSMNYSYISYETENQSILQNDIINSTLVIVPRGPVYVQWEKTIKENTTLKYLAIENINFIKKNMPKHDVSVKDLIKYFNQFDLVLIKSTTLELFQSYYINIKSSDDSLRINVIKRWKRIMIDEAHDVCNNVSHMYYEYLWLISGTHESLLYSIRSYKSLLYNIKDAINFDTIDLILVRGKREFVRNSFKIPQPIEKYYVCKMQSRINVIKNFVCKNILDKINANDIEGAIKDLGGKSDTQTNIVDLVTNELIRDISNHEMERNYVLALNIPDDSKNARIKTIDSYIENKKERLKNLTDRINECDSKTCAICMYDIEHPIILECTHSYCASCIVQWLNKSMHCPECRQAINTEKMISVTKDKEKITQTANEKMSKTDRFIDIIKSNPSGKYLLFSQYDSNFADIAISLEKNNITCSELKGNTAHMMNTLNKFKSGELKVILLNTNFAGSGIDISCATDVIIYHSMGIAKNQAIGRAQRVGRTDQLTIHYLCYEHELDKCRKNI